MSEPSDTYDYVPALVKTIIDPQIQCSVLFDNRFQIGRFGTIMLGVWLTFSLPSKRNYSYLFPSVFDLRALCNS